MRSASTVSGPLLSVSTPASQQNRFAAVHLLTGQLLYFIVEGKSRVKEVFSQLTTYMIAQGMQDIELFALAFFLEDEYFFTDPECKLSKYSPKSWKSSSTFGLDQNGQPLLQLHLRVKFYVDTTKSLRDDITRQHFYLQLRKNIADRGGTTEDGDQNVLPLVALGLQADLGDHTADTDISSELLEQYLPSKVYKNNEHRVKQTLCTLHKSHKGLSKSRAQTMFVQEAGLVHKSHLYRLRLNKSQPKQTQGSAFSICNSVWLAICTNGIQLFHESLSQALSCLFLWNNIVKLCFDRKKFELRPSNADRLVYYTNSDEKSKRLLALCRDTHQFCMMVHPRLLDTLLNNNTTEKNEYEGVKWTDEKKSKSANDSDTNDEKKCENGGGCSDSSISTTEPTVTTEPEDKVQNGSISSSVELGYSHTAQNSTVSELDYSVQSAQDSSEAYLMYRHPRARAAYVENSNQSAHTSSGVYTCPSYSSASKDTASASYTTENCSSVGCNDSNGDGGYKATVASVAAAAAQSTAMSSPLPPDADSAYSPSLPPDNDDGGRGGNAQQHSDAAVDDCDGVCGGDDELYDLSAAATSDSSYCVGGGATTASDIAPSASLNGCESDGYADAGGAGPGGRSRSGSVVSNSGSFRGDGSDPSEGGRGALLSAAELSDLIVGRKSLHQTPRKGFYPSRPTTSSTLDSDSDYVTLPPPMNFVTGAPSLSNLSLANFDCGSGTGPPAAALRWDVHRSFDVLSNVVKLCGGHHHHPHQCVVNSNNYLDVHKSGTAFYHHIYPAALPPIVHARPPPPPPPPPRPKRCDLQLEQYKQQLRSDVDFVVYPLQDPAVSRQEYVDAKLTRSRLHQQQYHRYFGRDPPSYPTNAHLTNAHLYRSTPNVAAAYARQKYHHQLHHPMHPVSPPMRTYSHDDLLSATDAPDVPPKMMHHIRRRPPPPPPPLSALKPPVIVRPKRTSGVDASTTTSSTPAAAAAVLDIASLREQSRNLDLPLISALCNDQTLLKQTNAMVTKQENKATQTVATAAVPPSPLAPPSAEHQPPATGSANQSNCSMCTNGTASYSSPPPPSFLSAAAPTSVATATTAAVKTAKSKANHVKTNAKNN
ncbi:Hypothetical protein CINCED_3A013832 [Cinara cedri]|nr:Hypothetical protein CINCED_3A013832 [Cinara cedri]